MGLFGLGGSSSGASAPTYDEQKAFESQSKAAQAQQYGMKSAFGNVNWTGSFDDGTRQMEIELSPFEQAKLDAAQGMLGSLSSMYGDDTAKRAEEAVYNQFAQKNDALFKQQKNDLHDQLINQGLAVGSEAYNKAMQNMDASQNDARLAAQNQSVLTGSQTKSNELNNALTLFGTMQNINNPISSYMPGIGTSGFADNYTKGFDASMDTWKTQAQIDAQNKASNNSMLGGLLNGAMQVGFGALTGGAGPAALSALGAAGGGSGGLGLSNLMNPTAALSSLSDERAKENIEPVGRLNNGLTVYKFNFIGQEETHIGLIAQEVLEVMPEAVYENEDGLLEVDYDLATQKIEENEGSSQERGI
ncbi:MAG: tail fiber domain-containing protein [Elusimicrobiota bacterium]|jgi:hypothetical protein|nr:tail fiber domain-containing protein [Elusimicrobiota bacterium]